jgi:tRNA A58 N-methylase Trm61
MKGLSINSFDLGGKSFPLIWGGDAANYFVGSDPAISKYCFPGSMNSNKVQGKIVLCENPGDGTFRYGTDILIAHGVGTIIFSPSITDYASSYTLPATLISTEDGLQILDYIKTTE